MIKNYILGVLLIISTCVYAQENKNKFMINANVQFYYANNSFNLGGVNVGYFISDHFAIGVAGNYYKDKSTSNSTDFLYSNSFESTSTSGFSGLFARYNYVGSNHKLGFFMNFAGGYRWTKSNSTQTSVQNGIEQITKTTRKSNGYSLGVSPGIIYFPINKFSIEVTLATIAFRSDYIKDDYSHSSENDKTFETAFFTSNISLGFSYYFGCKNSKGKSERVIKDF